MSLLARNRNFRLLFSAAAVSNLGDGIAMLAFPWLATLITRDATLIALVAAATRLPWLLFSLPAGVITDQFDRRRLIRACAVGKRQWPAVERRADHGAVHRAACGRAAYCHGGAGAVCRGRGDVCAGGVVHVASAAGPARGDCAARRVLAANALGGLAGPWIAKWLGGQLTLLLTLFVFPLPFVVLAVTGNAWVAGAALFIEMFMGMTWNVVTVSLRQRLIPDGLLGRVNSIYRFFGWGTIPLGAVLAGVMVSGLEADWGREAALRAPYVLGAVITAGLALYGVWRLKLP